MYYVETSEPLLTRPMVLSCNEVYFIYLVNMWVFILYAQNIQNLWAFKYDSSWLKKKSVEFLYTHVYGMCDKGIHTHTRAHIHTTHTYTILTRKERECRVKSSKKWMLKIYERSRQVKGNKWPFLLWNRGIKVINDQLSNILLFTQYA